MRGMACSKSAQKKKTFKKGPNKGHKIFLKWPNKKVQTFKRAQPTELKGGGETAKLKCCQLTKMLNDGNKKKMKNKAVTHAQGRGSLRQCLKQSQAIKININLTIFLLPKPFMFVRLLAAHRAQEKEFI